MKVLVTGAGGQLGLAITQAFPDRAVAACRRADLDVRDHNAILATIGRELPNVLINCAAFNDVDGAEDDPLPALETNAFAVRSLARAAAGVEAALVHYGSDFVFDGRADRPYTEDDRPNPQSAYAASKLLGDWFAAEAPRHYVLRVESLFGGARAKSSIDRIVDALMDGREARVFVDRTVTPSYVVDVAAATRSLIEQRSPCGLYHCVNSGVTTWHDVAVEAARQLRVKPRLLPVRFADVVMRAVRPQYCALSNAKLASVGVTLPDWKDALGRYLEQRRPTGLKKAQGSRLKA